MMAEAGMICAVCCHATFRSHANTALIGREDCWCFFCFLAWYEGGLVTDADIRRRSITVREEEAAQWSV